MTKWYTPPPWRRALQIAKRDIVAELDQQPRRVFSSREIASILAERRGFWRLAQSTTIPDFIRFLRTQGLREVGLDSVAYTPIVRYVWRDATSFEIALSIKSGSYFSHGTAVFLHNLSNELPRTIYINQEQSPKASPSGEL
jgi:hypothetical protein